MKACFLKTITFILVLILSGCSVKTRDRDIIYQTSAVDVLFSGEYDGEVKIGELKKQGDFGIGTINGIDGEMVAFDGGFFVVKEDGKAYELSDSDKTPFSMVTFFDDDLVLELDKPTDFDGLKELLDEAIGDKNIFHAIKIEGGFPYMKTKSMPGQSRPYIPFKDISEKQVVFELEDTSGTLVGFFGPDYVKGVNIPGYHFHYLTDRKDTGGHVLELECSSAKITIDDSPALFYSLEPDLKPDRPLRLEVRIEKP